MRRILPPFLLVLVASNLLSIEPLATNEWRWRFVAGGATVGAGAFSESGRYYFPAEDRFLYALDGNGTMIWRTDLGRRATGGLAVLPDQTVIVSLVRGRLVALNQDGRLIWQFDFDAEITGSPLVLQNGLIVVATARGKVSALAHHGREVWSVSLEYPPLASPIVHPSGTIVIPNQEGGVELYRPDGSLIRRRYLGENATVLAADERILLGSTAGRLLALTAVGDPLWRADVGSAVRDIRIDQTGEVYTASDDGTLARVTAEGVVAWRVTPGQARMLPPAIAGDRIITASSDGVLTAFDRAGTAHWQMRTPELPTGVELSSGRIVLSTQSWVTYSYETDGAPAGAWPVARSDDARTGGQALGRADLNSYASSADYLAARGLLMSGSQSDQVVTVAGLADRAVSGDLTGSYHWVLALAEYAAGLPYLGPVSRNQPVTIARRARSQAVAVVGLIGDLQSVALLSRLLVYEPDRTMQGEILAALGRLGARVDTTLAIRLQAIVREDLARGADDGLAQAVTRFVLASGEFRGGYMAPEAADVLLQIASSNYSRETRLAALDALRSISGSVAPGL